MRDLAALFSPRSVALVGATDNSQWSVYTHANLRRYSPQVTVHVVHPRHETVHGQAAHRSLTAIGDGVDLAFVMVPTRSVTDVVNEAADNGTHNFVVLTAGFGEAGPAGAAIARELEAVSRERELTVLGPNGNGFINVSGGIAAYGLPIAPPLVSGPVGVVLQSGGLAAAVLSAAQSRGVGLSLMVSTGNELLVSATDIMRHLIDDEDTRVIAAFLESVRHPDDFREMADLAMAAGKPIVVVKVGRSEQGARTALAHTGALAGDDRIIDTAFRQLGVVRVDSLEEMLATAGYLGYHPEVSGRRIAAVTPSGGACDLLADRAEAEGLELPEFPAATLEALTDLLPPFSNPRNPLDVTGYIVVDPKLALEALRIVAREAAASYDMILYYTSFPRVAPRDLKPIEDRLDALAEARAGIAVPVLLQTSILSDLPAYAQDMFAKRNMYLLNGIELGTRAIGHGARWHERRARRLERGSPAPTPADPVSPPEGASGVWVEYRSRALLESHGIPVSPSALATTPAEAAGMAGYFGGPVAMKISSDQIIHKSDVGGVRLNVDPTEAASTFSDMIGAMGDRYQVDGVLVAPMRTGGVELLVGVFTDPGWGKLISVGLGGIWVEVLGDVSMRLLPVDEMDVAEMLEELKAAPLFRGARSTEEVDMTKLCEVIASIARLAEGLGPSLDTLEINPLRVDCRQVEVLDALLVWK